MIAFDRPRPVQFRHFSVTAHLISTLHAPHSTEELVEFAVRIGLRAEWIQYPGHWKEHFDLFDEAIHRARSAGALEVSRRRLAEMNPRRILRAPAGLRFGTPQFGAMSYPISTSSNSA